MTRMMICILMIIVPLGTHTNLACESHPPDQTSKPFSHQTLQYSNIASLNLLNNTNQRNIHQNNVTHHSHTTLKPKTLNDTQTTHNTHPKHYTTRTTLPTHNNTSITPQIILKLYSHQHISITHLSSLITSRFKSWY